MRKANGGEYDGEGRWVECEEEGLSKKSRGKVSRVEGGEQDNERKSG